MQLVCWSQQIFSLAAAHTHRSVPQDTISGRDFARSLVSGVQAAKVDTYLDRIDALPQELTTKRVRCALLHFAEEQLVAALMTES